MQLPERIRGNDPAARKARLAWTEMHRAGDAAAEASRRFGPNSPETRRHVLRARRAQEDMLTTLGLVNEEVRAAVGRRSRPGLESLALMRY
jgi:hypothetical protein